jgi:hypothetical protein
MTLNYPFGVIDYESSGLDYNTYPIEIGIAIKHSPEAKIKIWSSLIQPTAKWLSKGVWNPESEKIHGISRQDLEKAPSLKNIVSTSMKFAKDIPLYFDGGKYDFYWHSQIVEEYKNFNLNIIVIDKIVDWQEYMDRLGNMPIMHRAAPDARQNLELIESIIADNKILKQED